MASSPADRDDEGPKQEIRLVASDGLWVATDVESGVASQGESRADALANLDEALALHRSDIPDNVDSLEVEREVLRELDIDHDEIEAAREGEGELPEFMQ